MAQHGDTVETEAECKARVPLGIPAAVLEHVRVHRTATADFHPAGSLAATATLATAEHTAHVHFGRRLREGEEARAEARLKNPKNSLNIITLIIKNSLKRGNFFCCSEKLIL